MKLFYLIYFISFITLCFFVPLIRLWQKEKIFAVTFKNTESAHDYIGKLFKIVIFLAGIPILLFCFKENMISSLVILNLPSYSFKIGLVIMVISLFWVFVAQAQMQSSWRIGIDYDKKTELVNNGLFKYSRNPIYFGMHGSLLGIFLVMPNMLSLFVLVIAHILMQIQTRLKEEYLHNLHGDSYLIFKRNVRRWI